MIPHKVCEAFWMLLVLVACSCKGTATGSTETEAQADGSSVIQESADDSQAVAGMFAMPAIPDSLRTVKERAGYFVAHYWDAMDFADTSLSLDTAFVEQNFANFISLLPVAAPAVADSAVSRLLARSASEPRAFDLIVGTAADYLDHPNSPMRDEETYIIFLRNLLAPSGIPYSRLTEAARLRFADRLTDALKNRPGTPAADFRFIPRASSAGGDAGTASGVTVGPETTLRKALKAADMTLVVFYDPDCEHCKEIMGIIASASLPSGVQVLAIDAEPDRRAWERTAATLPVAWTVGFATTPIADQELYAFPAAPTLYLLDRDGTVVMKDPSVDAVMNRLRGA